MAEIHPSMTRLYAEAAKFAGAKVGQSALGRLLNRSPQVVKNWETRGLSKEGALEAQAVLGVDSNWLLTGEPVNYSHPPKNSHFVRESHSVTLDPDILHEALTLLKHDEHHAGEYSPRAQAKRLAELIAWVTAEGGRLSNEANREFERQVDARRTGVEDDERGGEVRRRAGIAG